MAIRIPGMDINSKQVPKFAPPKRESKMVDNNVEPQGGSLSARDRSNPSSAGAYKSNTASAGKQIVNVDDIVVGGGGGREADASDDRFSDVPRKPPVKKASKVTPAVSAHDRNFEVSEPRRFLIL